MSTLSMRQDLGCPQGEKRSLRFLKSRQKFGRACFRRGPSNCVNFQDRRGAVKVSVGFMTSCSMMQSPALEYSGRGDWTCRGSQVVREKRPQLSLWKGRDGGAQRAGRFLMEQGATGPWSAVALFITHEEVGL